MKLLFEIDRKDYDPAGEAFVRPSARAVIFRQGRLAVISSRKNRYCKIPGGGIEPGETAEQAMIREVLEETGLTVLPDTIQEFGYVHRIQKGKHEPVFIQDNFYYFCQAADEARPCRFSENEKKEEFEAGFVPLEEAISMNERYVEENPTADGMIARELRVMKLLRTCRFRE